MSCASLLQSLHHHPRLQKAKDQRTEWLQTRCPDLCGHEVHQAPCAVPPQISNQLIPGPTAVRLQSQQACSQCSNDGPLLHPPASGLTYAWILFVDFSSAFNTILSAMLQDKLFQLHVPDSTCRWITDFLSDRKQRMKLGKHISESQTIGTRYPQGCMLFPMPCTPTVEPPVTSLSGS